MKLKQLLRLSLAMIALAAGQAFATVTYYHNDVLGSPVRATDEAGVIIWKESYRPYGETLVNSSGSSSNRIWYAGRPRDAVSGLEFMGSRWYDPVAGRFVSTDPKAFDDANMHSHNRYAYANNNPYRFADPDGATPVDAGFALWDGGKLGGALLAWSVGAINGDASLQNVAIEGMREHRLDAGISLGAIFLPVSASAIKGAAAVAETAAKEGGLRILYHYTDQAGAKGIAESGTILSNAKGQVFLTEQKLSQAEASNKLFIGRGGDKGSHVVEIRPVEGLPTRAGKNTNEIIHQGAIREGRQGSLTVKQNDF